MNDDDIFRFVLILAFALILPVAFFHRFKAATSEKLDRRQEGLVLLVSIRLLGLVGMLGLLAFMIDPTWMAWASVPMPVWLRWAGVAIGVVAVSLLTWTFRNLGKNITDTVVTRKEHFLVMTGPYRWVRHPFYVAFALAMVANSLVTANWFVNDEAEARTVQSSPCSIRGGLPGKDRKHLHSPFRGVQSGAEVVG